MAEKKYLYEQSKSYCKFRGIITGLDNPRKGYGFIEDTDKSGNKYRSLRFGIKTSDNNIVPVEIYGIVQQKAYFYSKTKKELKECSWDKRATFKSDGFERIIPDYDKAKEFFETFHDGDAVVIIGGLLHSEYTPTGKTEAELQTRFIIKNIYPATESIEFNVDDFEEESIFEEEVVINEVIDDNKEEKLYIFAYSIGYGDRFSPCKFEVNKITADKRFIQNLLALKYGSFIKLSGIVHNRALTETIDTGDDGWGTKARQVTNYHKSLEVTGAYGESLILERFTVNEIAKANAAAEEKQKAKNQEFNPTKSNVDAAIKAAAQESDELPFDITI